MSPFTCPRCGRTSHHPRDLKEAYCGGCHAFTGGWPTTPVTDSEIAAQRAGGTLLGPGIWADLNGTMHIDLPEFLATCGWPNDEEHRAKALQVVREVFAAQAPDAEIIEQE